MVLTTMPWGWTVWGDQQLAERARAGEGGVEAALELAHSMSRMGAALGSHSWPVLSAMATLGSIDLSTARAIEPHLDAQAILHQARLSTCPGPAVGERQTWGVYAAHPPGTRVQATPDSLTGGWTITGAKPWCSLADQVSHALVTASVPGGAKQLFALDLADPGVRVDMVEWEALGLRDIHTGTVELSEAAACPVGPAGWYVDRPGFAWGGIAVAAIWFGAAAALAGELWAAAQRRSPDQIALMHIGACEAALHGGLLSLRSAAVAMDDPDTTHSESMVLATRTRATMAGLAEQVLTTVGHALGPGPLAFNREHATRVADLTLYIRQHHAERDLAHLGELVTAVAPESGPRP